MAMEAGELKEAAKAYPFWLPVYPAIVEIESFVVVLCFLYIIKIIFLAF